MRLFEDVDAILLSRSCDFRILGSEKLHNRIEAAVAVAKAAEADKPKRKQGRQRRLPAQLMVHLIIGMALLRTLSVMDVFKELVKALGASKPGLGRRPPSEASVVKASCRVPVDCLKRVFELSAAESSPPPTFYNHRLHAIDGVRLTVRDTKENEQEFGRPSTPRGTAAYPVVRLVIMASPYSHRVEAIDIDRYDAPEIKAVPSLIENLGDRDLVIVDRLYPSGRLFWTFQQQGVKLLARLNSTWKPKVLETLGVGDYMVEIPARFPLEEAEGKLLSPGKGQSKMGRPAKNKVFLLKLRLLVFTCGKETIRLLTSLPADIPAIAIARLYHQRWEIELTNDEVKNHLASTLHGSERLYFRSIRPQGVRQEIYGTFIAYNFIRDIIEIAAHKHGLLPIRISFVGTLNAVRRKLSRLQTAQTLDIWQELYDEIASQCRLRLRRPRQYARKIKVKMSDFKCKTAKDVQTKVDFPAQTRMVEPASVQALAA